MPSDLKQRIQAATLKSLTARNRYNDQVTAQLTQALKQAEDEVARAILQYRSLGSLPDNKLAALKGLEKLQLELDDTMKRLKREQTLVFRKTTKDSFKLGIQQGIGELADAALPFYADLKPEGIDKLATKVFTIVDTNALDFMAQYNLTLAGDVHRELADGIKRTILNGVATGKGADDIVRDMGKVIVDKDSFRQAGSRVFSKAQYRMEMIARTEVLRAHNMGRLKFHERVGIQKLEWLAMEDERMCPVCGGLDGKTFPIDKFPQQPAHPHCRCTNIVAWPMTVCGSEMVAKAAAQASQGDACILPPHVLEGMADAQAKENAKLKSAFENGDIADLGSLTVKQLQTLAKQNGVAIARTKADFIKLLDLAEPGIDHGDLAGAALSAKLKEHKIGLLRTKEELVELLGLKQAELKQAKLLAAQMAKIPPAEGLEGMTAQQLKEMAKENGISLNMTKQETIELLDKLEPGVDHSGLMGKELAAAKQKHGIGILKNKQQLVEALQKKAGADMAESVKKKAVDEAKQKLILKQKTALEDAAKAVVVPDTPTGYKDFLDAIAKAEQAVSGGTDLPQELLAAHSKEIALKKQLFQDQVGKLKSAELKTLAKETKVQYWQWANKDELTTLFTETDPAKIKAVQASIDTKHAAWAEKHGGKKKTAPAKPATPKKEPPKPAPQPSPVKPPEAKIGKKGAEFATVDSAWQQKGLPSKFKKTGKAAVGGAHEKEFWTDENGDKWLFKPIGRKDDEFIAFGEEAAYKIGRLIDPHSIEVRTIQLNGRTGSIQKWRTDLRDDFDFRNILPQDLTTIELEQIQREHVVDWLIANHDGHSKQFIRARDGRVYGIDKGQAFKFLGQDKLSLDYHPNGVCGEEEPFYNKVFRAAKEGKVRVDPNATLRYIQEVEKIADEDYLDLLRPYAEGRFAKDPAGLRHFYDLALERKHNLRRDFEGYYADVLGDRGFRFDKLSAATGKKKLLSSAEETLVEEARKLGWQGKTLPFDSGDVEDQNALIFTESFKGKKRTVVKMKIRPDTDRRIDEVLRRYVQTAAGEKGQPLVEDSFFPTILDAVKNVNFHVGDGKYNRTKIDKALRLRKKLETLQKSADPKVKEMADHYLKWVKEIEESVDWDRATNGVFEQYLPKLDAQKPKEKPPFKVERGKVTHTKRRIGSGTITVEADDIDNRTLFNHNSRMQDGHQYTVTFEDGTRVRYRPWSDTNLYAQRGELEMILDGDATPGRVEAMLEKLEQLGIDTRVATAENAEQMYLEKLAYIRKTDKSADYKRLQKSLDDRNATTTERVQALRGYWQKELGVQDITQLSGYNPLGEYQAGFLDRDAKGGYRHQFRFDITEEDLEKQMKGYSLVHDLTNGESMSGFIDLIMENNGAMVSTVEKMRMGVAPGGMSPVADMQTGGASYFFTRIKKQPASDASPALYFKKQMLRRMDAISYDHDAYGKVIDDYVQRNRGASIDDWKRFSQRHGNETIFKYSVTLLDNIEFIVARSDNERREIIQSFTRRGIKKLPDGRKVEDIVHTPQSWSKRKQ